MKKEAINTGLSAIPQAGPSMFLQQALLDTHKNRQLTVPGEAQLKERGLSPSDYDKTLSELLLLWSAEKSLSDVATSGGKHLPTLGMLGGAGIGGAGGAFIGNSTASRAGLGLLGAALGGTAGYLDGSRRANAIRRRYLNTAKLLRSYGVLNPDHLRVAAPMLRHDPNRKMLM